MHDGLSKAFYKKKKKKKKNPKHLFFLFFVFVFVLFFGEEFFSKPSLKDVIFLVRNNTLVVVMIRMAQRLSVTLIYICIGSIHN